ncbi:hypothetical protein [Rhizobium wenxiniae]|uniref:hypothetical protein n=1 Tax=Rhizobium wenxiniae TaxID=1737357 RepID=UPI003C2A3EDE
MSSNADIWASGDNYEHIPRIRQNAVAKAVEEQVPSANLQQIYDAGWSVALQGGSTFACPHLKEEGGGVKFEAWMDGYLDCRQNRFE